LYSFISPFHCFLPDEGTATIRMRHRHTGFEVLLGIVIVYSLCLGCCLNEVNFCNNWISHVTKLTFIYYVVTCCCGNRSVLMSNAEARRCDVLHRTVQYVQTVSHWEPWASAMWRSVFWQINRVIQEERSLFKSYSICHFEKKNHTKMCPILKCYQGRAVWIYKYKSIVNGNKQREITDC
jgi:hypothetical protein